MFVVFVGFLLPLLDFVVFCWVFAGLFFVFQVAHFLLLSLAVVWCVCVCDLISGWLLVGFKQQFLGGCNVFSMLSLALDSRLPCASPFWPECSCGLPVLVLAFAVVRVFGFADAWPFLLVLALLFVAWPFLEKSRFQHPLQSGMCHKNTFNMTFLFGLPFKPDAGYCQGILNEKRTLKKAPSLLPPSSLLLCSSKKQKQKTKKRKAHPQKGPKPSSPFFSPALLVARLPHPPHAPRLRPASL